MRIVTNDDLKKYERMVNMYISKHVIKNWRDASFQSKRTESALGNTGLSLSDIKQHLLTEVVVALQKYNPNYLTKDGKTVQESTFVYGHLNFRVGQLCKKLTHKRYGYGKWMTQLEQVLHETEDQS
jgi:hypothetical protein